MDENISCDNTADRDIVSDAYRLIRSAEIRDYLRKENFMGIFEAEQVILHSYIPAQQKAAMLERLSQSGDEEENRKVGEMCRIYKRYLKLIYQPVVRTVFLLECDDQSWGKDGAAGGSGVAGVFDTADELAGEMAEIYAGCEAEGCGRVTVLQVPPDAKVKDAFHFTLFWIDGSWQVKDLKIREEELEAYGFSEDTVYRFGRLTLRHPLPYKDGERLKLQMPFMEAPVYGTIWSEKDGNGCWYHWLDLEGEDGECIDMSNTEFFLCSGYSTLDWIERA